MKKVLISLLILSIFSCATVTDSVVSAINDEQYDQLNYIYILIQDYQFYNNQDSLNKAIYELDEINLDEIYNGDYRSKVFGLKALSQLLKNNRVTAKSHLKKTGQDEELYWIVDALLEKEPKEQLKKLKSAKNTLHNTEKIDDFLGELYMENELYGEAAAIFDTILLKEEYYKKEYKNRRDIAYQFINSPPANYTSGLIATKKDILVQDIIDLIKIETTFFNTIEKNNIYKILIDKNFIYKNILEIDDEIQRKDLAYFLFALIAERDKKRQLWSQYDDFFNPEISEVEKLEMKELSPIKDTPIYEYFFYPTLFLIEEEIMELPDGENFFPYNNVSGKQLHTIISSLKKRLD